MYYFLYICYLLEVRFMHLPYILGSSINVMVGAPKLSLSFFGEAYKSTDAVIVICKNKHKKQKNKK